MPNWNQSDIDLFSQRWGVDPDKAAQAFGVTPPLPPEAPPANPLLSDPRLTAGIDEIGFRDPAGMRPKMPEVARDFDPAPIGQPLQPALVAPAPWSPPTKARLEADAEEARAGMSSPDRKPTSVEVERSPEAVAEPQGRGGGAGAPRMSFDAYRKMVLDAQGIDPLKRAMAADVIKTQGDNALEAQNQVQAEKSLAYEQAALVADRRQQEAVQFEKQMQDYQDAKQKAWQEETMKIDAQRARLDQGPGQRDGAKMGLALAFAAIADATRPGQATGRSVDSVVKAFDDADALWYQREQAKLERSKLSRSEKMMMHEDLSRQLVARKTMRAEQTVAELDAIEKRGASNMTKAQMAAARAVADAQFQSAQVMQGLHLNEFANKGAYYLMHQPAPGPAHVKVDENQLVPIGENGEFFEAKGEGGELRSSMESAREGVAKLRALARRARAGEFSNIVVGANKSANEYDTAVDDATLAIKGGGKITGMNSEQDMVKLKNKIGASGGRPWWSGTAKEQADRFDAAADDYEQKVRRAPSIFGKPGLVRAARKQDGSIVYVPSGDNYTTGVVSPKKLGK